MIIFIIGEYCYENRKRITGAATDVCVLETCSYAFSLGYNCIVPIETTASFTAERKKMGLELLSFGRGQIVNEGEIYKIFT